MIRIVETGARSASDGLTLKRLLSLAYASGSCLLLFAACANSKPVNEPDDEPKCGEVKEHRDHWRPRESQSDFLDIGKQAGIEWLSFYPQDQLDYPEYFEGLDREQKRRLRLAPKGSDDQVLIQFDLPEGSKLWPVDWYGTELMAIDLPTNPGISVAVAKVPDGNASRLEALAEARVNNPIKGEFDDGSGGARTTKISEGVITLHTPAGQYGSEREAYGERTIVGRTGSWRMYVECLGGADRDKAVRTVLNSISIKRELALEGSPKHKCTSSLEEQLGGTLRFPDGTLQLPIENGQLVRKIGADTTIQIDGQGAKPWILIRRLKDSKADGDIRARVRRDTTFLRRTKVPSAQFSAGYVPQDAKLPLVVFDYDDSSAENQLTGVLKAGDELLTFEVVTQGVTDGDARRAAKKAALTLLAGATGEPATEAPEFEPLIGWNVGTMGSDD
ncbi:MAG: hypothetical protein KDB90_09485 [Planctomycetes bacterium]|nr:hypothetical protein [Planctomycetota bacterium]